ncbi:gustatory receptor for sugar taste 64e-like [Bicyclus anynana]|uniref:Gustatory receptor n=1 Tax=Bicyclus anynana TaxID=110368 RepID=A0A6J1P903_BICAN|nr:gustatory receptor for sugar taste 64e-like [Bicyclus anynana]
MDYPFIHKVETRKKVILPVKQKTNGYTADHYEGRRTTFHSMIKLTVIIGQLFALNPVQGAWETDSSKLRFNYFTGRCAYTILTILCQVIFLNVLFLTRYFTISTASVTSNTTVVFFATNTTITILFLRIATKWPKLCHYIARIETIDPLYDKTLVRRCNISCILILLFAFLEHILAQMGGVVLVANCKPETSFYKGFITHNFPWIDVVIPYNPLLGILTQCLNFQCTFNWNFADVFVICISFYLTSRLEQVNKKIAAIKGKLVPSSLWRTIREDYNRATSLVRRVNDVIGSVIFISFANNLFFICLQLLHTLADGIKATPPCSVPDKRLFKGYEYAAYFAYSLIFLVLRSMTVSLIASRIHTASREPVYTLYEVPSPVYCIEVQRFIEQIHGETVALTGLQFFKVKRGIVLAIAGTIVTYELVLMQFAGVTPTASPLSEDA